jgi:putative acyl-CoA dehydrogenase
MIEQLETDPAFARALELTPVDARRTHRVLNQAPPLVDYNPFSTNPALVEAVQREGAAWAHARLIEFGGLIGGEEAMAWASAADRSPPILHTHDARGVRIDRVEYHPAYHHLMELSVRFGLHAMPWREPRAGAHVARAALLMLASENDFGHCCPISMTFACVPSLRKQPELAALWEPRICSLEYDSRFIAAAHKRGVTFGMAMTEKQGGSDVRANTTYALPIGAPGPGRAYRLTGHKWFCSAPMSDAFLVLAQTQSGLSCLLVPRILPDGTANTFRLQRLKDKLGNRSNASSEVELDASYGELVGEEGRGVSVIIEMVACTRLDSALGAGAVLRRALTFAVHHTRHRVAFGHVLADAPLMQNVLADLALESEAATLLLMRLARAYDDANQTGSEAAFRRLTTALAKYWISKRAPAAVAEALECLGGNGYVEDFPLARLYREAPINSIWEGSGNVICLDVLRAIRSDPATLEAWFAEVESAAHADERLRRHVEAVQSECHAGAREPFMARRIAEHLALGLQAALLVRHAPPAVADAFCATRLAGDSGHAFGTLPSGSAAKAIIDRSFPGPGSA